PPSSGTPRATLASVSLNFCGSFSSERTPKPPSSDTVADTLPVSCPIRSLSRLTPPRVFSVSNTGFFGIRLFRRLVGAEAGRVDRLAGVLREPHDVRQVAEAQPDL